MHRFLFILLTSVLPFVQTSVERTLADDHFTAGRSITVHDGVAGDLVAAGGTIDVDTKVGGDAVVAGGEVRISGNINQGLYAAGGKVVLNGLIGRNARIGGGNVEITPRGEIVGNVSIGAGDIIIGGPVGGYVQATAPHVLIDSPVSGDVEATSAQVELGPKAHIAGKLRYTSGQELKLDPRAQVLGGIEHITPAAGWTRLRPRANVGAWIWTLGLMILAAFLVSVLPSFYTRVDATLRNQFGMSLLVGFVGFIAIPAIAVVLIITLIGIPLALLTVLVFLGLLLVGYVTSTVVLGDWLLGRFKPDRVKQVSWRSGAAALAVLLVGVAGKIPVLGGVVVLVVLLAGLGALILQGKRIRFGNA